MKLSQIEERDPVRPEVNLIYDEHDEGVSEDDSHEETTEEVKLQPQIYQP